MISLKKITLLLSSLLIITLFLIIPQRGAKSKSSPSFKYVSAQKMAELEVSPDRIVKKQGDQFIIIEE